MPVLQPVYKVGPRQRSIARNLIAGAQQPAAYILTSTLEYTRHNDELVVCARSQSLQMRAGIVLTPGQRYFIVKSKKWFDRWYVVTRNHTGKWTCSSRDERVSAYCIAQVEEYRAGLAAERAA